MNHCYNDSSLFASVVIPTYNRKETLKRTMEAVLNQSYPKDKYEIIIVDDGSSDGTKELIEELSQKAGNIKYLKQSNKGPASARNRGIEIAKGKIILFTDDDCIPEEQWIKKHASWHLKDDKIIGVGGLLISYRKTLWDTMDWYRYKRLYIDKKIEYNPLLIGTNNCSYNRNILVQLIGFDEKFPIAGGEDADLSTRANKYGKTINDPSIIVYHLKDNIFSISKLNEWFRNGRGDCIYRIKNNKLKVYQLIVPFITTGKTFAFAFALHTNKAPNKIQLIVCYFTRELVADVGIIYEFGLLYLEKFAKRRRG